MSSFPEGVFLQNYRNRTTSIDPRGHSVVFTRTCWQILAVVSSYKTLIWINPLIE